LKSLVLAAPGPTHAWRAQQIESLLETCPRLEAMDLGCLTRTSGRTIKAWLDEKCDKQIELHFTEEDFDNDSNDEYEDGEWDDEGDEEEDENKEDWED
ncbi:hypothetical protein BGX26_008512, partial [Mortierella sp. AD094]